MSATPPIRVHICWNRYRRNCKVFIQIKSVANHRFVSKTQSRFTVVVEHKLKLERLLKDEKLEHVKSKEELNELIRVEKELRDKQNVDAMNRYNEIERSHEVLQVLTISYIHLYRLCITVEP